MINYTRELVKTLTDIHNSYSSTCIYLLKSEKGMGKRTIVKHFVKDSISKNILQIQNVPYEIPLRSILYSIQEMVPSIEPYSESRDGSLPRYIKSLLFRRISEQQKPVIVFHDFNKYDEETAHFIFDLLQFWLNNSTIGPVMVVLVINGQLSFDIETKLSRFSSHIQYLPFKKWIKDDFKELLAENYPSCNIDDENLSILSQYALNNAGIFLNNLEYLKSVGKFMLINGCWQLMDFNPNYLLNNFQMIVKQRYDLLDDNFKEALKKASIIGNQFDSETLESPLKVKNANIILSQIENISRLVHCCYNVKNQYEFESKDIQLSIESYVEESQIRNWNFALATYYNSLLLTKHYHLSRLEFCDYASKAGYYYEKCEEYEKALSMHLQIISSLIILQCYRQAIETIRSAKEIVGKIFSSQKDILLSRLYYWEAECYKQIFMFSESLVAFKHYLAKITVSEIHKFRTNTIIAYLMYNNGETMAAYKLVKHTYDQMKHRNGLLSFIEKKILVEATSLLSSIEETLGKREFIQHYNEALATAKSAKLNNDYYILLRKAGMAHEGLPAIKLMEAAKDYFENNDELEYALTLHNLGSEQIFAGSKEDACKTLNKSFEILSYIGHHGIVCVQNAKAIYAAIHKNDYFNALNLIKNSSTAYNEDFALMVLKYNVVTLLRSVGNFQLAEKTLSELESINNDPKNQLPYFKKFIYAQRGYLELAYGNHEKALSYFIKFIEHRYADRYEYYISIVIQIVQISHILKRELPAGVIDHQRASNTVAELLAENKLIFCEILFWE